MSRSLQRKIDPLDEYDLAFLVLYDVVAVHRVAVGLEVVRPFDAFEAARSEQRFAHRLGISALRGFDSMLDQVYRAISPRRKQVWLGRVRRPKLFRVGLGF